MDLMHHGRCSVPTCSTSHQRDTTAIWVGRAALLLAVEQEAVVLVSISERHHEVRGPGQAAPTAAQTRTRGAENFDASTDESLCTGMSHEIVQQLKQPAILKEANMQMHQLQSHMYTILSKL